MKTSIVAFLFVVALSVSVHAGEVPTDIPAALQVPSSERLSMLRIMKRNYCNEYLFVLLFANCHTDCYCDCN